MEIVRTTVKKQNFRNNGYTTTIEFNGNTFGIYDKERLICDCLKYESKMEHDDFKSCF